MNALADSEATPLERARSVRGIMGLALLALLPGVLASAAFFGIGVLLQILLAVVFAMALEAAMLALRGRPLQPFISDLSAPLAAVLFALYLPPLAPWWLAAIGMVAAIVVGKHLYGGLGHNLFNPAMVGVAVVMVCFPNEFNHGLPSVGMAQGFDTHGLLESMKAILTSQSPLAPDSLAQAPFLDATPTLASQGQMAGDVRPLSIFVKTTTIVWQWIAAAYALGGLFMLWKKIIRWQTPAAVILTMIVFSVLFWQLDSAQTALTFTPLMPSSVVLVAFFIATDPVSGCTTPRGRWIFGAGVAFFTLLIERWGAYPGGVAFAVFLMNCAAPYIYATSPPRLAAGRSND